MSILSKTKLHGNERLDLTDYENIENFTAGDFNEMYRRVFTGTDYIIQGLRIFQDAACLNSNTTSSPVYIKREGAVFLHTSRATGSVMYVGAAMTAPAEVNLTSNSINYIEVDTTSVDGAPDTRAFWDPTANGGIGEEFAQTVNTATFLVAGVTVNTVGWSGGNLMPVCEVHVNAGGTIIAVYDRRNLFFRLGKAYPYADDYEFAWPNGRQEALHTMQLTGGSGSYSENETIQGMTSGTQAVVVTPGTTTIVIRSKTAASFTDGESIHGLTGGAARTLSTVKEDFTSADKSIVDLKTLLDALTTEIKRIKFGDRPNRYWFEDVPHTLSEDRDQLYLDHGGTISWSSATSNITFTSDFQIAITGTVFNNYIRVATQSPIHLPSDNYIAYVDINLAANVDLVVHTTPVQNFVHSMDRYIIARRINNDVIIYDVMR